jgi:subtilisin family serine protease
MPHRDGDRRYPHLRLAHIDQTWQRRGRPVPPSPPPARGGRGPFGAKVRNRLTELEQEAGATPPAAPEIQPHLVFRVPLAPGASSDAVAEKLEAIGLHVVSIEPDRAVVAFHDDQNLSAFRDAMTVYEAGPGTNPRTRQPYKTTSYDVFEYVEADQMKLWSPQDRIGPRLAHKIGSDGSGLDDNATYVVELDLWHRGTTQLADAGRREIEQLVSATRRNDVDRVVDWFIGEYMCLVKAHVRGSTLKKLLDMPIVAEIDLPPTPVFDAVQTGRADKRNFAQPPQPSLDGPRVCVVDSGIAAAHPLLASNVGHEEAILTAASSPADQHGHGTRVGAIAVFGSVRACYESGAFSSPVVLFSARVLNEHNHFDDERLIVTQMQAAIGTFKKPPHACRVFNLSLGTLLPANSGRQSTWAEALDVLAREEQVVIVVSAGNNRSVLTGNAKEAEAVLKNHPSQLRTPEARLSDPATAAIAITVGALVEHEVPAARRGPGAADLIRPLGKIAEPSPFTRVGPGLGKAVKPEFVDYGGNLVWEGTANTHRRIRHEDGVSVMSFEREHTTRLFAFDFGTSYAAPRLARIAAILWHRLHADLGKAPHPNLVRAVLATAASVPEASRRLIEAKLDKDAVMHVCGYGQVDEELAVTSSDRRVTLVAEGTLKVDHFRIYEVPTPDELRKAKGEKRIIVALAFDPPVRRRRLDYLGVRMDFMLIRGKTPDEIADAYAKVTDDGPESAFGSPFRVKIEPPQTKGPAKGTLQRGEFRFRRERTDYGDTFHLVVRASRRWAPPEVEEQSFAVAVALEADDPQLYARLQARARVRGRARP